MLRKISLSLLVVAASLGLVGFSQTRIDALREEALKNELLYIPSKAVLKHLTAGMNNVVADLLWLETIKYTVAEFHNPERKFKWLEHMLNAAVDLDPYFEGVYVNGGMFLSSIGAEDKAMDLLKKGFVNNPRSWEIPHEIVKVYILNRRDDPTAATAATHYLRMVAERHDHPQLYLNWARHIQEEKDLGGESRAIWEDVIRTAEDPFVRELAERNLRILIAHDAVDALQEAVNRVEAATGRIPDTLHELVDGGWIQSLPNEDELGAFFIHDGDVHSALVLEDKRERMLMYLNARLRVVSEDHGRHPATLEEFAEWNGEGVPPHPVPGKNWTYDPQTGEIS